MLPEVNFTNTTPGQEQAYRAGSSQAPRPRPVPSIGRIVHYRLDGLSRNPGEYRPAIIVRVSDSPATPDSLVQLQVFTDGDNDGLPVVFWAQAVALGDGEGQYCWPPFVPAK